MAAKFWARWPAVQDAADMPQVLRQAAHDLFATDLAILTGTPIGDDELRELLDDTHALLCYAAGTIRALLWEAREARS